ncbi:MAG: hypothetical protein M3Z36_10610 [Acidobacteriota bacterium]|nr:hypothetical protein [Acidobacteriota bacterium]
MMIQEKNAKHKGIEIELNVKYLENGKWTSHYTLVEHTGPETIVTHHYPNEEFETVDAARKFALEQARLTIERKR